MAEKRADTAETMEMDAFQPRKSMPVNTVKVRIVIDGVSVEDKKEILRYLGMQRYADRDAEFAMQDVDAIDKFADSLLQMKDGHIEVEYDVPNKLVDFQSYADASSAFGSTDIGMDVYKAGEDIEATDDKSDPAYWNCVHVTYREGEVVSMQIGHLDYATNATVDMFEVQPAKYRSLQSVREEVELHINNELNNIDKTIEAGLESPEDSRQRDAEELDAVIKPEEETDVYYPRSRF